MSEVVSSIGLVEALRAEGVSVPENCREARLACSSDDAIVVEYTVLVTDEDLARLGRALIRVSEGK